VSLALSFLEINLDLTVFDAPGVLSQLGTAGLLSRAAYHRTQLGITLKQPGKRGCPFARE